MVERYAHVAAGHKREAIEALARGERLERTNPQGSGTQTGTDAKPTERPVLTRVG
jgi:hypothetical protein